MPWMTRAIWSAPPPGPAGTMISTGRVGSHAASDGTVVAKANATPSAAARPNRHEWIGGVMRFTPTGCLVLGPADPVPARPIALAVTGITHTTAVETNSTWLLGLNSLADACA